MASSCQWRSSRSLPEPAMMDATRTLCGYAFLIRSMRGIHQSNVLSEMSSQFHDECSAVPGRFCMDRCDDSGVARRNLVFGPATLTTGCRPIVLVTTPPHPASKARMMLPSDSVGGADESRNGLSNERPVNTTPGRAVMVPSWVSSRAQLYPIPYNVAPFTGEPDGCRQGRTYATHDSRRPGTVRRAHYGSRRA